MPASVLPVASSICFSLGGGAATLRGDLGIVGVHPAALGTPPADWAQRRLRPGRVRHGSGICESVIEVVRLIRRRRGAVPVIHCVHARLPREHDSAPRQQGNRFRESRWRNFRHGVSCRQGCSRGGDGGCGGGQHVGANVGGRFLQGARRIATQLRRLRPKHAILLPRDPPHQHRPPCAEHGAKPEYRQARGFG